MKKYLLPIISLILLIHLYFLVHIRFTAWPEMMLWPYLILKGWLPYRDIAIAHNPLLITDLVFFNWIFGLGIWQLKVYTWILILLTDLTIFWTTKKIWGMKVATLALVLYLPISLFYEGNGLWFDLALTPIGLLIYLSLREKKVFLTGIFWALAFLVKQTAFWFLIPITIFTLQGATFKGVKRFIQGVLIIFVPVLILMWFLGILPEFIFWAYRFGIWQLPRAQGQIHLPALKELLVTLAPFFIFACLFFQKEKKNLELVIWALSGVMGVFPRFELFHFQPAVPFLTIGAALVLAKLNKYGLPMRLLLTLILILNIFIVGRFLVGQWQGGTRFFEPEIIEASSYIKNRTIPQEEIYIINVWDNLYALSDTLPATRPWIPHLSWYMELPGIQEEIVSDLAQSNPKLIVQGEYEERGLGAYQPIKIDDYISQNYKINDKIGKYLIWVPK